MEVNVANEAWGFMSSGSNRSCSLVELENGPSSSRSDDELSEYSDTSVISSASKKSKKHVQFQADDNLELVYEIPPRGHYSSTDQTDSDSTDDEDNLSSSSDTSSESTEISQNPSFTRSRFHISAPSTTLDLPLSHPSVIRSSFYNNNMSPAKGSYSVCKSKDKVSSVVTKITGVIPFRSNVASGDRGRHGGRVDKGVKRTNSRNNCNGNGDEKPMTTRSRVKGARKRANLKIVDVGKNNIILKRGKDNSKTLRSTSPRIINGVAPRCNSTVPSHSSSSVSTRNNSVTPRCKSCGTSRSSSSGTPRSSVSRVLNGRRSSLSRSPSPSKRVSPTRSKTSTYSPNKLNNTSITRNEQIDVSVEDSLKNLNIGKVYTVDGFIFPQDPVDQIHPRDDSTVDSNFENQRDVSNSSVQRKRCLSWKMANASSHCPVLHTPCILPLWESVQSVSLTSKPSVKTKF